MLMNVNLHICPLICILMNIAYHLHLKTGPILFIDINFIEKDISVVHFNRNNKNMHVFYVMAINFHI